MLDTRHADLRLKTVVINSGRTQVQVQTYGIIGINRCFGGITDCWCCCCGASHTACQSCSWPDSEGETPSQCALNKTTALLSRVCQVNEQAWVFERCSWSPEPNVRPRPFDRRGGFHFVSVFFFCYLFYLVSVCLQSVSVR